MAEKREPERDGKGQGRDQVLRDGGPGVKQKEKSS
jgi:hypothetical protein